MASYLDGPLIDSPEARAPDRFRPARISFLGVQLDPKVAELPMFAALEPNGWLSVEIQTDEGCACLCYPPHRISEVNWLVDG